MAASRKKVKSPPESIQDFPIVGIGASAGGLDAFKRLLKAIPEDSGMAYVLVQHLDPSHESILPEILARVTNIPVHEITEDIHLAPDHIYVIPSNKILISTDGVLQLATRDKKILNLSIDVFLKSLAEVHTSFAVGVVLSGTGSDGTLGLKAIKEHGGISIAQDKQSAAYDSMPQSAVNAGVVDFILAPEKIPAQLLLIKSAYKTSHVFKEEDQLPKDDENIFKQILSLMRQRSSVDFTYYKQNTIRRRVARRMALSKTAKLSGYLKFLRDNKPEQDALFYDILIPVTSFFRDPKTFKTLYDTVFPTMFKNKSPDEPIRIWVAGCSTGEEAYSLAICLHEYLTDRNSHTNFARIQIFASDISEKSIKKARAGIYSKSDVEVFSDARLKNYFIKNNGGYEVSKLIRDVCVFAPHNFLKDPPFAKIDLLSCRNVLIYLDSFLQKKALTTFHYALKENGFLLLGKSETSSAAAELFTPFTKHDKIYSRKPVPGRFIHIGTERKEEEVTGKNLPAGHRSRNAPKQEATQNDFRKSAEAILLSKYTPAGVIVNEQMDIVHIHGVITPFLEPSPGKPTFNLLKMAREGLSFELRNALHKAKTSKAGVIKEGISVKSAGKQQSVTIEIIPLTNTVGPHFLILFKRTILPAASEERSKSTSAPQKIKKDEAQRRIGQLKKELAQARDDMRSITEEQEAANEELQAANEELQSSNEEMQSLNEEMQSLNEELETSKEELQSTNEELTIVNQELLEKQEQLIAARFYSEAIVTTIREPLIVLDKALHIVTTNASFNRKFNITEKEIEGKFFYEIGNRQFDDNVLRSMLEKVLPQKTRIEDFEIILRFPSLGERTLQLNARQIVSEKTAEQLILLAIEDITERKLTEQKLKTFTEELEVIVEERTAELQKSNSELRTAVKELKQTNLQLEQFAHVASHDLQEPLRKILVFSNQLLVNHKDKLTEETKNLLNKIEASSSRMRILIQDVLDYSHITNYKKLFEQTNLNETLKDILSDFELLIEEKKAAIKNEQLPTIEAMPLQMNQLFCNLISNSLKFSKQDIPPLITITSRKLSTKETETRPELNPELSYCEIIFKDNGIGFDQKYAEHVFTIFQRLEDNKEYPGTGIGLALCRKIAENHNGEITAEGKEDVGSEFRVILPVEQPA